MKCKQVIGLAEDYSSNRIGDSGKQQVEIHLQGCESCRQSYALVHLLVRGSDVQPRPQLESRVRALLFAERQTSQLSGKEEKHKMKKLKLGVALTTTMATVAAFAAVALSMKPVAAHAALAKAAKALKSANGYMVYYHHVDARGRELRISRERYDPGEALPNPFADMERDGKDLRNEGTELCLGHKTYRISCTFAPHEARGIFNYGTPQEYTVKEWKPELRLTEWIDVETNLPVKGQMMPTTDRNAEGVYWLYDYNYRAQKANPTPK